MSSATDTSAIVGIGYSDYSWGRSDISVKSHIVKASLRAATDAGIDLGEIDGIIAESAMMPMWAPIDSVAAHLRISEQRRFTAYSQIAGAGNVFAPVLAAMAIQAGLASTVLIYFGMTFGSDEGGPYAFHKQDPMRAGLELSSGWFGQPVYFAAMAQRYKHEFGLEPEDLGAVAISARNFARLTPGAMRQAELTMAEYLASPMIAEPLRLLDCCMVMDGAAAMIVTSTERARDLAQPPVIVAGGGTASSPKALAAFFTQSESYLETPAAESAHRAFHSARMTPSDVGFAEIYDCFTISTILQLEDAGFCKKGEGAAFISDGGIDLMGALPVNTHGGLLSHSYLVGIGHVLEAVQQIRGQRGEAQVPSLDVGLISGLGYPDHSTLILTSDR
jgi:acetyl-CoA acetyltransferase